MDYDKIIMDCYRELFANSAPKGDFNELLENATINEQGQKEIPYMDYEIEVGRMEEIVRKHQKKIKNTIDKRNFYTTIMLGCSPRYKNE